MELVSELAHYSAPAVQLLQCTGNGESCKVFVDPRGRSKVNISVAKEPDRVCGLCGRELRRVEYGLYYGGCRSAQGLFVPPLCDAPELVGLASPHYRCTQVKLLVSFPEPILSHVLSHQMDTPPASREYGYRSA